MPACCRTIGHRLEDCLLPTADAMRASPEAAYEVFAGGLSCILTMLEAVLKSDERYAVFIWLTYKRFSSLHWRAWALLDLRNSLKMFHLPASDSGRVIGSLSGLGQEALSAVYR